MLYLQNAWYAGAWSQELTGFIARTFLDVPVLLLRRPDGTVAAFHDQCPHRFAPLSMGALVGDRLRCIYHGLEFDMQGNCVGNALKYSAPRAARVRVFPTVEQDNVVWLWMGSGPPSDPATLPRFEFHAGQDTVFGATVAKADYRLLADNLMDLTHIHLLHPGFQAQNFPASFKWREDGDTVVSHYLVDQPDAPSVEENIIRWSPPGLHRLDTYSTPKGGKRELVSSAHLLTPESETTTHYFWSSGIPSGSTKAATLALLDQVFNREDKPLLEGIQKRMAGRDFWQMKPLLLQNDHAAVRIRRKLQALMEAEQRASELPATGSVSSPL